MSSEEEIVNEVQSRVRSDIPRFSRVHNERLFQHIAGSSPRSRRLYFPSIPFFTFAVGGFGPSHTDKSTGRKAEPAMVTLS